MGFFVKNRELKSGSVSVVVPAGDTVLRPHFPVAGQIRYNDDLCKLEYFNSSTWRAIAAEGQVQLAVDYFVGDGFITNFGPMVYEVSTPEQVLVFVGSIYQIPAEAYTVNGQTIIFSSPVPNGVPVNIIHNLGSTVTEGCPVPAPTEPDVDQPMNISPAPDEVIDFAAGGPQPV